MASALLEMTAFSPCSQLGDMMMIGMEASLESFPGSREDGNKRSHSDGDEEQDKSHVKKRRKQSKPIRITTTASEKGVVKENDRSVSELDFSETGEHFLSEGLVEGSLSLKNAYQDLDSANQETSKTCRDNQDKSVQSETMFNSLLPLNLSSIRPPFVDSPAIPAVNDSQNTHNKQNSVDHTLSQFQTQDSSKTPSAQEISFLPQSPSLLLPIFKQSQIHSQMSQITSQMRIFNPEAFCDLCNKEFCNKYFLKTHKANKHGIYSENLSGQSLLDPMPSLPFTNYFSTGNETFDSSPPFQVTSINKNLFSQTNLSNNRSIPKKTQALQPQQPQTSLFSLKSNSSGNMRALCNICQREFCNKYFVRRHKLKIHGIVEPASKEGSITESQENSNPTNISQDKLDLLPDIEMNSGYFKQFMPLNFSTIEVKDSLQNIETIIENPKDKLDKETENDSQVTVFIPPNILPPTDGSLLFKVSQTEENNKENTLSSTKLKKLGVVNADAFCDICCKEYCNKYFLRTHKLKSHGIIPAEEKKDNTLNGASGGMPWYQNQSTPLNLIVNDTSAYRDVSDNVNFDGEVEECICDVCGRYFQSQFLLKMHQAYTHPNKFIGAEASSLSKQNSRPFDDTRTKDVKEIDKSEQTSLECFLPLVKSEYLKEPDQSEDKTEAVNTENFQKLQNLISRLNNSSLDDSSVCDVCNKDVGHISQLENHILKEHAVLLEEMGNITEEDNSSSQGSLVPPTICFKKECPHCQQLFYKSVLLDQHINEVHNDLAIPTDSDSFKVSSDSKDINTSNKMSPTQFASNLSDERQGPQTPTSSFCEICKKELCNKYFMKTHMQRMHGISIENGAQIGGVVCDICNKELCSKYFLRVHKQNSHGIVDELFLPQLGLDFVRTQSPNTDQALKPTDQTDLNHRYFTHFNEVCIICNRRFRSVKWLKAHLLNDHGDEGKEKWKDVLLASNPESKTPQQEDNLKEVGKSMEFSTLFSNSSSQLGMINIKDSTQNGQDPAEKSDNTILNNTMFSMLMNGKDSETKHYQCSYCSFTTSILAFLFIHERSHMNTRNFQFDADQPFQCPICCQNLESKDKLEKHVGSHKMSWQQLYSSSNPSDDLDKKCDTKHDFTISKEREVQQHPDLQANLLCKPKQMPSDQSEQNSESSVQCPRCGFRTNNIQVYTTHLHKEHPFLQMDQELPSYLQQMERTLTAVACNAGIPAAFAVPRVQAQNQVTMQPFVLEDSDYISNTNNSIEPNPGKTFLSSLVFLPVREKLKKSVTASFKLTPT